MTSKVKTKTPRRGFVAPSPEDPPLLRVLISRAMSRGETLSTLARALGVSYERVTQWRRREADISRAHRAVHEAAAAYLGVPTVHVLCMAGLIRAADFIVANGASAAERIRRQLETLKVDPAFAGFVPEALRTADPSVQWLVTLLYREVAGGYPPPNLSQEWFRMLQLAELTVGSGDKQDASAVEPVKRS